MANTPDMAMSASYVPRGSPSLTPDEVAAYDAPFPDARYKAGVRRFPTLVPDPEDADGRSDHRAAASVVGDAVRATASWPSARWTRCSGRR